VLPLLDSAGRKIS
jgi:hypothetical protein